MECPYRQNKFCLNKYFNPSNRRKHKCDYSPEECPLLKTSKSKAKSSPEELEMLTRPISKKRRDQQ